MIGRYLCDFLEQIELQSGIYINKLLHYFLWKGHRANEAIYSLLMYVVYQRSLSSVCSKEMKIIGDEN